MNWNCCMRKSKVSSNYLHLNNKIHYLSFFIIHTCMSNCTVFNYFTFYWANFLILRYSILCMCDHNRIYIKSFGKTLSTSIYLTFFWTLNLTHWGDRSFEENFGWSFPHWEKACLGKTGGVLWKTKSILSYYNTKATAVIHFSKL